MAITLRVFGRRGLEVQVLRVDGVWGLSLGFIGFGGPPKVAMIILNTGKFQTQMGFSYCGMCAWSPELVNASISEQKKESKLLYYWRLHEPWTQFEVYPSIGPPQNPI